MSLEYIRDYYGVNAAKGGRVNAYGKPGTITGARRQYLLIKLDGATQSKPYHPKDGIEYLPDSVELSVRQDSIAGYVTSTVRGKRCSCTHDGKYAVERLAEKLFPGQTTKIESIEFTPAGRLHSKWRITVEAA